MSPTPPLGWEWLGTVPYREALARQRARRDAILAGEAGSTLWLLEHPPIVTEGRRAPPIPTPVSLLAAHGIDWERTERGGLATYHGPGQLVGYLLCDLAAYGLGVRQAVGALEQGLLDWLHRQGVPADRRPGYPGAWVGHAKIAAVGLNIQRHVSMHGFALNLTVALAPYALFVPCGITDGEVTSLAQLRPGAAPGPAEAAPTVAAAVLEALLAPGVRGP
ncbi:MAG: lipoyl(octanoyl) transferase LipB [Pseudomonadota bacterium]